MTANPKLRPGRQGGSGAAAEAGADRSVGILLVHGMGEQKPGEFADNVARNLVKGCSDAFDVRETTTRESRPCARCGPRAPCTCCDSARVVVRVATQDELVDLHCHEVWWADLGQRTGFRNWLRLLWWIFRTPWRSRKQKYPGELEEKRVKLAGLHNPHSHRTGHRGAGQFLALFLSMLLAFATVFTWGAIRRLLRGFAPSPVVLLQSFGDVHAFQADVDTDVGSGPDTGLPPRFGIRRRMIGEMIAMAERDYDEWYVLAHSLGTVIAFNGLMEPDFVLPNYVSREHWARLGRFRIDVNGGDPRSLLKKGLASA